MTTDVYLDPLTNYAKIKLHDWYYILLVTIKNFEVILIALQSDVTELDNWVMLLTNSSNSPTTEGTISGSILEQFISLITLTLYESSGSQNTIHDISSCSAAIDLNLQIQS